MQPRRQSIEKQIQAALVDRWLLIGNPGTLLAAIPNEGAFGQPGLTKGLFDLIAIGPSIRGGQGWLELKRPADGKKPAGKLTPEQEDFRALLVARGIEHAVADSLDEAVVVLEFWGMIRRVAAGSPTGEKSYA